jgi:transcriptional regulator with XRE-family HTH domain
MCDLDEYFKQKKAMGKRFKQFRELLGKSRKEIENEANFLLIQEQRIKMVEIGAIIPDILFIQYFTENYGLNLTWLVKGTGKPFLKKSRSQMTEDGRQRAEDGRQRAEDRRQMTEDREKLEILMISRLINSIHYLIDCVFIGVLKNKFRLVVLQHQEVLYDQYFSSFEKCQMAFDKIFIYKAWSEKTKANWSHLYPPDQDWLAEKQSYLESCLK